MDKQEKCGDWAFYTVKFQHIFIDSEGTTLEVMTGQLVQLQDVKCWKSPKLLQF